MRYSNSRRSLDMCRTWHSFKVVPSLPRENMVADFTMAWPVDRRTAFFCIKGKEWKRKSRSWACSTFKSKTIHYNHCYHPEPKKQILMFSNHNMGPCINHIHIFGDFRTHLPHSLNRSHYNPVAEHLNPSGSRNQQLKFLCFKLCIAKSKSNFNAKQ